MKRQVTPLEFLAGKECKPNEHKIKENKFGVPWCTNCGRLFTKPSKNKL